MQNCPNSNEFQTPGILQFHKEELEKREHQTICTHLSPPLRWLSQSLSRIIPSNPVRQKNLEVRTLADELVFW